MLCSTGLIDKVTLLALLNDAYQYLNLKHFGILYLLLPEIVPVLMRPFNLNKFFHILCLVIIVNIFCVFLFLND